MGELPFSAGAGTEGVWPRDPAPPRASAATASTARARTDRPDLPIPVSNALCLRESFIVNLPSRSYGCALSTHFTQRANVMRPSGTIRKCLKTQILTALSGCSGAPRGRPHIDRCGKLVSDPGAALLAGLSATGIREVRAALATLARFVNKNESV